MNNKLDLTSGPINLTEEMLVNARKEIAESDPYEPMYGMVSHARLHGQIKYLERIELENKQSGEPNGS